MITIAKFNSYEDARNKLNQYNAWARNVEYGDPEMNLVDILKHQTLEVWWFSFSDCVENGGIGRDLISADLPNVDSEDFEDAQGLIAQGYLSQSTDE